MSHDHFDTRDACPACRGTDVTHIYSSAFSEPPVSDYLRDFYAPQGGVEFEYLKDADFILDECLACGLIYQRLIPNSMLMKLLYEKWIDPSKAFQLYHETQGIDYYAELASEIDLIIRCFGRNPSELTFFDFGMGWGDWCRLAQAYGCEAYGSELCRRQIDYARRFGIRTIEWEDIPQHEFDLISTEQVLEHVAEPLETLTHLCRALKPDGIIKISVPNGWDIKGRLRIMDWQAPKGSDNSLNLVSPLEHINCFNENSLVNMARKAGLTSVDMRPTLEKRLLDRTAREILRPYYRKLKSLPLFGRSGSTCQFFRQAKQG